MRSEREIRSEGLRPRWPLALLPALLLDCGQPTEPRRESGVRRLQLASFGAPERRSGRIVAQYEALETEGWSFVGCTARPSESQADMLLLEGGTAPVEIGIPGEVDPDRFNRLAVTLRASSALSIHVRQGAPGEHGPVGRGINVARSDEPTTLLFDLDQFDFDRPRLSHRLSLFVPGGRRGDLGLIDVALIDEPIENWLPAPEDGETILGLMGEERSAVGLTSIRPLRASFRAEPGMMLSLSVGAPPISAPKSAEHRVRLTVADDSGRELSREVIAGPEWTTVELPLESLEGPVELGLELSCDREQVALAGVEPPIVYRPVTRPRTVLLVTSDTHRADHLGVHGGDVEVSTPNIDALAAAGTYFEDAISATNVTKPSHVALMTGVSPRDTGIVENVDRLNDAPTTLAERFREAGWATWAAVSMAHLSHERSGLGQGFDRLYAPTRPVHESQVAIDRVLGWLPEAEGRPLFVWLHAFDVHTPYVDREEFTRLYYPRDRDPRSEELEPLKDWQAPAQHLDIRDPEYLKALYRGEVSYLDGQLGRLFSHGRFQDAVIAFTADHGESFTAHSEWFNHGGLYPQTLRVPLILKGPGVEAGIRSSRPVQNTGLGRTLLELAGLDPEGFPGRSLLEPAAGSPPRFAVSVFGRSAAVFHDRWLLVLHLQRHWLPDPDLPEVPRHSLELYDLENDPDCLHDVQERHRERAGKLRGALVEWLLSARPGGWNDPSAARDADALAALQQLGYATSGGSSREIEWFDPECGCEQCLAWR